MWHDKTSMTGKCLIIVTFLITLVLYFCLFFVYVHPQRKMFIKFARVFPLFSVTGWKPDAQMYRRIYGTVEVVCGIILALIPGIMHLLHDMLFAQQHV